MTINVGVRMFSIYLKFWSVVVVVVMAFPLHNVRGEQEQRDVVSAISDMESLISTESVLMKYLQKYLMAADQKLMNLKRAFTEHIGELSNLHEKLELNNEVLQSLARYQFLSRYNKNIYKLEDLMEENPGKDVIKNMTRIKHRLAYPSEYDLSGAVNAISRLTDFYNMNVQNFTQLNYTDFYLIGLHLYNGKQYAEAEPWFRACLENLGEAPKLPIYANLTKLKLFEILAWCHFQTKNYDQAIYYSEEYLKINPDTKHVMANLKTFKEEGENNPSHPGQKYRTKADLMNDVLARYKKGCRNELHRSVKLTSQLTCWYLKETDDYLRYGPTKIEEINFDPAIFMYHDVISDKEIAAVKRLAKGRLMRSKGWDNDDDAEYKAEFRTNKLTPLHNENHAVIKRIRERTGHITGYSMSTAESLQITNYGIGGHYAPHHDFYYGRKEGSKLIYPDWEKGNRMSTLLFYLSDVESGGATVFPLLNVTVYPRKGSALFWYNLYPSGVGDIRTFHAGCPVLKGDKWILTQWIRERDQEFKRPCDLEDV